MNESAAHNEWVRLVPNEKAPTVERLSPAALAGGLEVRLVLVLLMRLPVLLLLVEVVVVLKLLPPLRASRWAWGGCARWRWGRSSSPASQSATSCCGERPSPCAARCSSC